MNNTSLKKSSSSILLYSLHRPHCSSLSKTYHTRSRNEQEQKQRSNYRRHSQISKNYFIATNETETTQFPTHTPNPPLQETRTTKMSASIELPRSRGHPLVGIREKVYNMASVLWVKPEKIVAVLEPLSPEDQLVVLAGTNSLRDNYCRLTPLHVAVWRGSEKINDSSTTYK